MLEPGHALLNTLPGPSQVPWRSKCRSVTCLAPRQGRRPPRQPPITRASQFPRCLISCGQASHKAWSKRFEKGCCIHHDRPADGSSGKQIEIGLQTTKKHFCDWTCPCAHMMSRKPMPQGWTQDSNELVVPRSSQVSDPVREPAELPELGRPRRRLMVQPGHGTGVHHHPGAVKRGAPACREPLVRKWSAAEALCLCVASVHGF